MKKQDLILKASKNIKEAAALLNQLTEAPKRKQGWSSNDGFSDGWLDAPRGEYKEPGFNIKDSEEEEKEDEE